MQQGYRGGRRFALPVGGGGPMNGPDVARRGEAAIGTLPRGEAAGNGHGAAVDIAAGHGGPVAAEAAR